MPNVYLVVATVAAGLASARMFAFVGGSTYVIMELFHSCIPRMPFVCAFQEASGLKDRVEVITTTPSTSPV